MSTTTLFLFVITCFIFSFQKPVCCENCGGTVLEIGKSNCKDMHICSFSCLQFVKKCYYTTTFFDIEDLVKKSPFETLAYNQVCIKKKYTKLDDIFQRVVKNLKNYQDPAAQKIVQCTKNFVFFFRDIAKKCTQEKNWKELLKKEVESFQFKECGISTNGDQHFKVIRDTMTRSFVHFQSRDDDIDISKYCRCDDFSRFIKDQKGIKGNEKKVQDFQDLYNRMLETVKRSCEVKCNGKGRRTTWRLLKGGISDFTLWVDKRFHEKRIRFTLNREIKKLIEAESKVKGSKANKPLYQRGSKSQDSKAQGSIDKKPKSEALTSDSKGSSSKNKKSQKVQKDMESIKIEKEQENNDNEQKEEIRPVKTDNEVEKVENPVKDSSSRFEKMNRYFDSISQKIDDGISKKEECCNTDSNSRCCNSPLQHSLTGENYKSLLRRLHRRSRKLLRRIEHRNENRRLHQRTRKLVQRIFDKIKTL